MRPSFRWTKTGGEKEEERRTEAVHKRAGELRTGITTLMRKISIGGTDLGTHIYIYGLSLSSSSAPSADSEWQSAQRVDSPLPRICFKALSRAIRCATQE